MKTEDKLAHLQDILKDMGSVLVAYSGGVDSAFLASVAGAVLGEKALAVFAYSEVCPPEERREAQDLAAKLGMRFRAIAGSEMDNADFTANTPQRCYYCRQELFQQLKQIAAEEGLAWIVDGSNSDDLGDYRPGRRAAAECGIRSPLCEAGLTKAEIRQLAREKGLPVWNKPASPCLASRIPYGTAVTMDVLAKISAGERYLRGLGIRELRLRHHADIARIEADAAGMAMLLEEKTRRGVVEHLKALGYVYITLDLAGFRSGSLNDKVPKGPAEGK